MADTSTIDRTSTHYKGKFATIYEVNRKYPNGGAEGDYVEIDGWAHYWNADRGTWTVNAERDTYWDEKWSGMSEMVKTLQDDLETETKNRTEADTALKGKINAEATARETADTNEASAREAADTALGKRIDDEASARQTADNTEAEARKAGDTDLGNKITAEGTARAAADTQLEGKINAEVASLQSEDADLLAKINAEAASRGDADTTHDARLLALEQSEWPLQLTLTATPELLEYTGEAQTVTLGWTVKRRDANVTPTALSLRVGGQAMQVIEGAKTATISVNAEGNTSITLHVEAEGMTDETTKTVTMIRAMYFGFAAAETAADLNIQSTGKQPIKTTPNGSYILSNAEGGNYLWLCVPDTMNISKVTSGGFDVPMEAAETKEGYKCYRSSNAIVAGTYNYQIA